MGEGQGDENPHQNLSEGDADANCCVSKYQASDWLHYNAAKFTT